MKLASTIGILLVSSAGVAAAQTGTQTKQIDLNLSARMEYDSNVFGINKSASPQFDKHADDLHFIPQLDFDIVMPVSRQAVYLNGALGYDFYGHNTELNRERIDVNGGARLDVAGCAPNIEGTYSRMQSDRYALVSTDRISNTETHRAIGARANCGGPIGLTAGGNYRHEEVTNGLNLLKVLNYHSDTIGANIGYTRPTFGTLSLYGVYNTIAYPNRLFLVGGRDIVRDGVEIYNAGVSFERNIGSRITGTVSAGYTWVTPKLPISPKFHGASYSLDITLRPTDAFTVEVLASRDASASNLSDVSYTLTDLYSLQGSYVLNRSLSLSFGASHQKHNLKGSPLGNTFVQADYDYTTGNVGVRYRWRKLTFTADVTQSRRGSKAIFQRYNDTRVGFGVALGL